MFGQQITKLRQKQGMSGYELAKKAGQSTSTISGIEKGANKNPSFRIMCEIAAAFGVSMDYMRDLYYENEEVKEMQNNLYLTALEKDELIKSLTAYEKWLVRYSKRNIKATEKFANELQRCKQLIAIITYANNCIAVCDNDIIIIHKALSKNYKRLAVYCKSNNAMATKARLKTYISLEQLLIGINPRLKYFSE